MMLAEIVYFPQPLIKVKHFDRCDERHKNDLRAGAAPSQQTTNGVLDGREKMHSNI